MKEPLITVGQDILQLIAEIDEFKGQWQALKTLSPVRLSKKKLPVTAHYRCYLFRFSSFWGSTSD